MADEYIVRRRIRVWGNQRVTMSRTTTWQVNDSWKRGDEFIEWFRNYRIENEEALNDDLTLLDTFISDDNDMDWDRFLDNYAEEIDTEDDDHYHEGIEDYHCEYRNQREYIRNVPVITPLEDDEPEVAVVVPPPHGLQALSYSIDAAILLRVIAAEIQRLRESPEMTASWDYHYGREIRDRLCTTISNQLEARERDRA